VSPTVAVIGGGISGLTVSYELLERAQRTPPGLDVICLEASGRPGGNIRTERAEGFVCEWGPNGFLDNAALTLTLVRRLGLEDRQIQARAEAAIRFIYRKGQLRRVPEGARAFLGSDILSPWGKLRLLAEPLMRGARRDDESVFEFAARRIGREAASVLVDAMVSGVYAGNVRELSLEATFPKMRRMESEHGSLFRAMLAKRKEAEAEGREAGGPSGPGGRLTSFRNGVQELTDALARELGPRLRMESEVRAVSDLGRRGYRVHVEQGAPLDVDALILACPAWHAAPLLDTLDPEMAEAISAIPPAAIAVVHSGYRRDALDQPAPEGFGFLVPRNQGPRILGSLWSSNIFEGRAPDDSLLLTTMIGGAHDPEVVELTDEALAARVARDLERCMGLTARPCFSRIFRHAHGIPQYTRDHPARLARIERRQEAHAGLWVCGNSYRGISINACIEEAPQVAENVLEYLSGREA